MQFTKSACSESQKPSLIEGMPASLHSKCSVVSLLRHSMKAFASFGHTGMFCIWLHPAIQSSSLPQLSLDECWQIIGQGSFVGVGIFLLSDFDTAAMSSDGLFCSSFDWRAQVALSAVKRMMDRVSPIQGRKFPPLKKGGGLLLTVLWLTSLRASLLLHCKRILSLSGPNRQLDDQ